MGNGAHAPIFGPKPVEGREIGVQPRILSEYGLRAHRTQVLRFGRGAASLRMTTRAI